MILLNMIIGLGFAFLVMTLLFLSVGFIEALIIRYYLEKKLLDWKILLSVQVSNLVSTLIGFLPTMVFNDGITNKLNDLLKPEDSYQNPYFSIVTILIAFLITILIESIINISYLKYRYEKNRIIRGTIIANTLTYIAIVVFKLIDISS